MASFRRRFRGKTNSVQRREDEKFDPRVRFADERIYRKQTRCERDRRLAKIVQTIGQRRSGAKRSKIVAARLATGQCNRDDKPR